jgi:hypothetical protein
MHLIVHDDQVDVVTTRSSPMGTYMRGEISRRGITYVWSVFGNIIIVTAPDGCQKKTHLGGVRPESMAKILARELEEEKPKIKGNVSE